MLLTQCVQAGTSPSHMSFHSTTGSQASALLHPVTRRIPSYDSVGGLSYCCNILTGGVLGLNHVDSHQNPILVRRPQSRPISKRRLGEGTMEAS